MAASHDATSAVDVQLDDGHESIRMSTMDTTERQTETSAPSSRAPSVHDSQSALRFRGAATDERSNVSDLPPVDQGRQAWTFLALATCLEMLIWGMGNSYGEYTNFHLNDKRSPLYGKSTAAISAPGSLIAAGQYMAPFLFLGLLNAFPHRIKIFSVVTLLVSAFSLLIVSFRPTTASVIILQGLFSGWAGGAFYTPAMLWLPQWFDEKRGLATGVIFLGSGLGGVVWPFTLNSLLQNVGFSWTMRVLCAVQLILGSIIVYFLRPRLPIIRPTTHAPRRRAILRSVLPSHNKILNSPMGVTYGILQFLQNSAFWSISYYLAPYASSLGLNGTLPTALLAAFNAASAVSYVMTGKLCDVLPHTLLVLLASATGSLLVGLLLGFARTIGPLMAFTVLYGLLNGGFSCTMSPMAREMAKIGGSEHSSVFLEFMAVRGLGGVVGPLISSTLYRPDSTPSLSSTSGIAASSIWGANAAYGSHGLGPIIIFVTVLEAVVAVLTLTSIPFRKHALRT